MRKLFKNNRQKALEEFLNDEVQKLALGVYIWRGKYYEVLPYERTLKRHNWSGFVRAHLDDKIFMIREASDEVLNRYYPKIWEQLHIQKSVKAGGTFIEKGKI